MLSCGCMAPGEVGDRRPSCPSAPGRHPAPAISSCSEAKQGACQHFDSVLRTGLARHAGSTTASDDTLLSRRPTAM